MPELPTPPNGRFSFAICIIVSLIHAPPDVMNGGDDTVLFPHMHYFEFTAQEDLDNPNPKFYQLHELEVGKRYCIYVTTYAGLYRYNMNDLIEVTGKYNTIPTIQFIQKVNGIISMTGEKVHERQFIEAVREADIAFLILLFTAIYVIHIHPEVMQNGSTICALGLIILMALLLNILFVKLFSYVGELFSIPPKLWYLALPLGFAPIVIGSLIGVRIALFSGLFIALVSSFSGMNQFNMVVFGMVVSALSSYMIKGCRNYKSLFLRGFFTLSIVSMILVVIFCWRDSSLLAVMPWPFILPIGVSIATIVLVQFTLFLLEAVFDLSSRISLNLYCDYNHPLYTVNIGCKGCHNNPVSAIFSKNII